MVNYKLTPLDPTRIDLWLGRTAFKAKLARLQDYKIRVNCQVVRLIGLLLVFKKFASPKIVHKVRNEMADSIVPLEKKIKDSLTRQGMWSIRGLYKKGLAEREEKERVLFSERAHKQVTDGLDSEK